MNGLLVGRFQPFHLGHVFAIQNALKLCEKLWLCIGSTNLELSLRNPFSVLERREMIDSSIDSELLEKIKIYEIPDVDDHKKWLQHLDSIVPTYGLVITKDPILEHLYSYRKERIVDVQFTDREKFCGTKIRDMILSGGAWKECVPEGTAKILDQIDAQSRLRGMNAI